MYKFFEAIEDSEKLAANSDFIKVGQRILKREWEVLKVEVKKAGT